MRKLLLWVIIGLMIVTPLAAQEPTPDPIIMLDIWLPDQLYNANDTSISAILQNQIEEFNTDHEQYQVRLRFKPSEGTGSILSTMQASTTVAPEALPDLVILRRSDLERGVQSGLVKTIDTWVPDMIRQQLLTNTLRLGEVNGTLYGLPYALIIQHLVYHTDDLNTSPLDFDTILESEQRFLLPGAPRADQQVNDVLLAQYVRADGSLIDLENNPTLNREAMTEVLRFYETGLLAGVFSADITTFDVVTDYWGRFVQGDAALAVVGSSTYLQQTALMDDIAPSAIPTLDGTGLTLLDGWMWALITPNPNRQNAALAILEWLMRPDQQAAYTEAFGVIPSQRNALRIWENESYATTVRDWLERSVMLPSDRRNNAAATQLQAAFVAVLNGTPTSEAVNAAFTNLGQ